MASTDEPVPRDENLRLADLRYIAATAAEAIVREEAAKQLKAAIIDRKAVPLLIDVSAQLVRSLAFSFPWYHHPGPRLVPFLFH